MDHVSLAGKLSRSSGRWDEELSKMMSQANLQTVIRRSSMELDNEEEVLEYLPGWRPRTVTFYVRQAQ